MAATVGCAVEDDGAEYRLNVVGGDIKINGKPPAEGTIVTLHPKDGGPSDQQIYGVYDADLGRYGIMTVKDGETLAGAPEGEYIVTVQSPKNKPGAIPAKYGNPKTSGLTMEVKPGANAAPEITLAP